MKDLNRNIFVHRLEEVPLWDLIIIGGGATGLGIALDGASRGYSTLLLEQSDFAKATSSRSTKLVHGGVRYLAQGKIRLVHEALRERGLLIRNAPELVSRQAFVIPCYNWKEKMKYAAGLKLYDWLAGRRSLGRSVVLNREQVMQRLPNVDATHLAGGVLYYDARFDDARLAMQIAQTAASYDAVLLNYFRVSSLLKTEGQVSGVTAENTDTGQIYSLRAKLVINATGVFVDEVMQLDEPGRRPVVRPSQGVHLVLDRSFLDSPDALLIPRTTDNRVLFLVPWLGKVLAGTTDTPVDHTSLEPEPLEKEIDFILANTQQYLTKKPRRGDVLSVFAGLRPLAAGHGHGRTTRELSRDHKLMVSRSGLITITGGKWTTYRKMADDVLRKAVKTGKLPSTVSRSKQISMAAYQQEIDRLITEEPLLGAPLVEGSVYKTAHVVWAVRHEMALTVEDVLARRLRLLFLDARAAMDVAPKVVAVMAAELHKDDHWIKEQLAAFHQLATRYVLDSR